MRADGSIDFHPVQFKVYRHTTLPPAGKQSSLPWPLPSFFGTLGISSSKPATPPIVSSAGVGPGGADGGPIQPPLPRRVLYYYAAFTGATAVAEVIILYNLCELCVCWLEHATKYNQQRIPTSFFQCYNVNGDFLKPLHSKVGPVKSQDADKKCLLDLILFSALFPVKGCPKHYILSDAASIDRYVEQENDTIECNNPPPLLCR